MKRHLIFFLFLFCALMAVDGRNNPQLVDKRMHFADIYKEPEEQRILRGIFDTQ